MNVLLSPETQRLLEQQMKRGQFSNPDEVLRLALQTLDQAEGEDYEELDPQVRSAIERGESQYERGEGRDWGQVRGEFLARFVDRKRD